MDEQTQTDRMILMTHRETASALQPMYLYY